MVISSSLCVDCQSKDSQVEVRKRWLCHECFSKYISSKILKRMETYRFKNQVGNQKKRLLLPISGGVSSLVLLQVLDAQVKKQLAQQNRTAYDIVVCHVVLQDKVDDAKSQWWTGLQQEFNFHTYLPIMAVSELLRLDDRIEQDLQVLGLLRQEGESNGDFLLRTMAAAGSATARCDMRELLLKRLLVGTARDQACDSIIWGHSDSKLAAKALSEVAKGRGGSVPNELADGPSPWGPNFNYPLRDVFRAELELYLHTLAEKIVRCRMEAADVDIAPVSLRSTSIDMLLSTYITSQGEKYPSIMANVVRTASKLQVSNATRTQSCRLCAMPVMPIDEEGQLCYGCNRMKQDMKT